MYNNISSLLFIFFNISSLLFISFQVVVHLILYPSREEISRPYMQDISHSDNEVYNVVDWLTRGRNGAWN